MVSREKIDKENSTNLEVYFLRENKNQVEWSAEGQKCRLKCTRGEHVL
jgi:hypothetical protein